MAFRPGGEYLPYDWSTPCGGKGKEGANGSKRNKNKNKKSGPRDEAGMMAEAEVSGG
jgi:hypothetical protein